MLLSNQERLKNRSLCKNAVIIKEASPPHPPTPTHFALPNPDHNTVISRFYLQELHLNRKSTNWDSSSSCTTLMSVARMKLSRILYSPAKPELGRLTLRQLVHPVLVSGTLFKSCFCRNTPHVTRPLTGVPVTITEQSSSNWISQIRKWRLQNPRQSGQSLVSGNGNVLKDRKFGFHLPWLL